MISLGMIVRDAEATLEQCLESVAPHVDEIVIGLGGESTDRTEEIARKFTDKVFPIEWTNDFSEARNLVLDKVSGDYFLWLDSDDELIGGEHLRQLPSAHPEVDAFYFGYDYSQDEHGVNNCYLTRERLIKLTPEWRWRGKIHEVLFGPEDHAKMLVGHILVKHHPQDGKGDRNLDYLYQELEASEPNPDARVLVYLGTENASRGNFREAINHLQRYVKISGWDEEKYQAQHRIADIYRAMGDFHRSRLADFDAISIRPDWPDAYLGLAETSFHERKFRETIEWTKAASTKKAPDTMLIVNPRDYDFNPMVILGLAYAQLRDFEMSVENFELALRVVPDEKILHNLMAVREELEGHQLVDAFNLVWEHLGKNDEWLKARHLFDAVPKLIEKTPPIQQNRAFTLAVTAHVEDPQLMVDDYRSNPNWAPMTEEALASDGWRKHPRLAFARSVLESIHARSVLDMGCSDGFMAIPLAQEYPEVKVKGIDLDPRCIQLAAERGEKYGLKNVTFEEGDVQEYKNGQKADLALFFEVIEHVVDPAEALAKVEKTAKHIAITTPHLAWDSPAPNWDREEFKGHLRIFDLQDMEALLSSRGQIHNLYRQPYGGRSSWIFADYEPGAKSSGHVTILAPGTPEPWSPLMFEREGLGGSETAVIKLGEAIARDGYQVSVFSRISDEGYFNRVRYRDQEKYVPEIRSELFIAWRAPELIDDVPNAAHAILWMHDTDAGDRLTDARAAKFESIVVLTEWHKQHMLEVYPFLDADKLVVIPNGVDRERFNDINGAIERNPKKVVYSSSPDRGLDYILEHIWPRVLHAEPKAELHIYYGWNNFDRFLNMFPQLREFRSKVMDLLSHSQNVVQHGRVDQLKLAKEMMSAGVWLYPTSFTETYCITAVEAQLAGCVPVTNDLAALAETVKGGFVIPHVRDFSQEAVMDTYAHATIKAMDASDDVRNEIKKNAPAYSWAEVASMWSVRWLVKSSSDDSKDGTVLTAMLST